MSEIPGILHPAMSTDGKQIVIPFPATEGWRTWFTGAGDDMSPTPPASGRGTGTKIKISFTGTAEIKTTEFQFSEPVELHDGELFYSPVANFTHDDRFEFGARMPASAPTANTNDPKDGNCNLYDVGGYNLLLPAAGNGTHDIALTDFTKAIPVPSNDSTGYWDVDQSSGAITASATPGAANWHLMDIQIKSYFLRNMPMGNPLGVFEVDVYKAEYLHPAWFSFLSVDKQDTQTGDVSAWIMTFRESTT